MKCVHPSHVLCSLQEQLQSGAGLYHMLALPLESSFGPKPRGRHGVGAAVQKEIGGGRSTPIQAPLEGFIAALLFMLLPPTLYLVSYALQRHTTGPVPAFHTTNTAQNQLQTAMIAAGVHALPTCCVRKGTLCLGKWRR